jgi:hypothetical protein
MAGEQVTNGRSGSYPMEGGTGDQKQKRAIQWREEQVTKGRSDSYPMEGGTGDQWQKRQLSNGGRNS